MEFTKNGESYSATEASGPSFPRMEDGRNGQGSGSQRGYEINRQVYGLAVPHHAGRVDARALEDDRRQFAGRFPQGFRGLFDDGETLPAVMDPLGFAEGDAERFEALDMA